MVGHDLKLTVLLASRFFGVGAEHAHVQHDEGEHDQSDDAADGVDDQHAHSEHGGDGHEVGELGEDDPQVLLYSSDALYK